MIIKIKIILGMAILGLFIFHANPSSAQIPEQLRYQGVLSDPQGAPLNGSFTLKFRIYDRPSGGSALWSETQSSVPVNKGLFGVSLGSVVPMDLPFNKTYWLTIEVGTDGEMTPRQQLVSVPYARRSQDAEVGIMPIGSIVAWHKSFPNTPSLPSGWVECNGQVLNDSESVYHGQTIPNLNGEARFLRGSAVSGTLQNATKIPGPVEMGFNNEMFIGNNVQDSVIFLEDTDEQTFDGQSGRASWSTNQYGADDRPDAFRVRVKNMSVVWIMRVK